MFFTDCNVPSSYCLQCHLSALLSYWCSGFVWWLGCDWFQFTVECCQSTAGLLQAISVFTASRQPTRVRLQLAAWGLWPWWCWSLCYWHECSQLLEFDHFASYIAGFDRLSALAYLHWVAGKAFVCAKYSTWGTRTVSESIS